MILLVIVAALLAFWGVRQYNSLKALAEAVRSRRANILAVTRKRADLASRLVDIAQGYGSHEKLSHFQISEDLTSIAGLHSASAKADRMIGQVTAMAQNFPDLKANQTYQQLMHQLDQIETEVLARREAYNQAVERYNASRVRLPQALIANSCGFDEAPYYETGADGLDEIATFRTGDTQALEEVMKRAGRRAQTLAGQTAEYARTRRAQPGLGTDAMAASANGAGDPGEELQSSRP